MEKFWLTKFGFRELGESWYLIEICKIPSFQVLTWTLAPSRAQPFWFLLFVSLSESSPYIMDLLALTNFAFRLLDYFAHFCRDLLTIIIFARYYLGEMWHRQLQHWRSWWICSKYLQASEKLIYYFLITHFLFSHLRTYIWISLCYMYVFVLLLFNMSGFSGLDLISAAKESVGYNRRIKFAIDVATTDFYVGK